MKEKFNLKIYNNIQKILFEKGIQQKQIAINLGTTEQNINKKLKKLQKGTDVTTSTLFEIAFALDVSVADLIK